MDNINCNDLTVGLQVDVEFKARVKYPVTLALLKALAAAAELPESVKYIGEGGFKAIKEMALVNRGRLSKLSSCGYSNAYSFWSMFRCTACHARGI
jgi:hypothetical protein